MSVPPTRVLLVEDNPGDARLIREALTEGGGGFALECVDSLAAALECLDAGRGGVDVVLLDLALPDSRGLDTLVRLLAGTPAVAVVVLTGTDDEALALQAVHEGAQDYLVKGQVDGRLMVRSIRYAVGRKRVEEALRQSEDRLIEAQEIAKLGYYVLDIATGHWTNSAGLDDIFGIDDNYTRNVDGWLQLVHPEFRDTMAVYLHDHVLARHNQFDKEYKTTDPKTGQDKWVHGLGTLRLDDSGNPVEMFGTIQDITERKLIEEALRDREHKYRILIDQSPDPIFVSNIDDFVFTEVNERACGDYGYTREEFLNMSIFDIEIEAPLRQDVRNCYAAKEVGQVVEVNGTNRRKDGSTFPVQVRFTKLDDESAIAVVRDITERKQMEEALRLREQQLRLIYDSTGEVLYYVEPEPGPHYRFLTVNNAFLEVTGLTAEQVIGKTIDEVIPEPSLTLVRSNYEKAIREHRIVSWEETSEYPSGLRTGVVSIAPVFDDQGNCSHLVGSVHDITERKRLERELVEIGERERERLGRDLHDGLGQPLTGVMYLAKVLQDQLATKAPELVGKAQKIGELAQETIRYNRYLSRGLLPVSDGAATLEDALHDFAETAQALFGVHCVVSCGWDHPVRADVASQLFRIAQEAVTNASRHAKATSVVLECTCTNERVGLVVTDDGMGIPDPVPETEGMGLRIMRYRAGMIGATLDITRGTEGGTVVRCTLKNVKR